MRVPLRWLSEFVEIDLPPAELAHRLTMAGLEAEKIEVIGEDWDKVYVGYVEKVEPHPDADRLVLATVDASEHRLKVVTGAPNIRQGQNVALALAGARLIDGHSEGRVYKTLKPSAIRGVRSEGMVCSEKELGLSDEHEGILVLPADAPVGARLADYLGDAVIEFEITPNLVHAFSIIGIAREAAAVLDEPLRLPAIPDLEAAPQGAANLAEVADPDLCSRYVAVVIDGIAVGPSPEWLTKRLIAAGLRPINNIVDVTNYVMLEWGQPLHAFDRDRLEGGRIVVRRARPGEMLETLDHQQRQLTDDMLVIADAARPVGVAGVMGGVDSEVDERTTAIVLESANFNMTSIRHTARALRLRTDASARFERGLDPNLAGPAAARATQLILDLCPGSRVVGARDIYPTPVQPRELTMRFGEIERLLGVRYTPERVLDVLGRLGFAPQIDGEGTGAQLRVSIPTWRGDVSQPADIVEEVARIIGYDTLPETLPTGETPPVVRDPELRFANEVRDVLAAAGAFETINYITVGEPELRLPAGADGAVGFLHAVAPERLLRLRNPIQSERGVLRPSLLPVLLGIAAANLKHETGVRIFEIGRVYLPSEAVLPREAPVVGVVLAGRREPISRFATDEQLDFFDLKGMVEALLDRTGAQGAYFERIEHPALHPGRAAALCLAEQRAGLLGELRPDLAAAFGIETERVVVAELDLDLLRAAASAVPAGLRVPRFLPVEQDFAVIVGEETPAAAVEAALLAGARPLATGIALFDIYRGPQLGEGRKSLAYRITFTAPDRALTDAELGKVRERIAKLLTQRVKGELRV
ncbi:MAG TPA: phenylalanine--tRNA ligase subunit beta [Thermomicrobiales bacterium]|nr:phenylalanine--tRNA ligase subunit beta [Thermomicrobiales bacterium]